MSKLDIRVWHDDIRPPPPGWAWARTNDEAKVMFENYNVIEISLDHDLGLHGFSEEEITANPDLLFGRGRAEETGYHLVNWMVEQERVPPKVTIHSWNPEGARQMAMRLNYHGYDCEVTPYVIIKEGR